MTDIRTNLETEGLGYNISTDFATIIGEEGEDNVAGVQAMIDLISQEATDGDDPTRGFLDEMSPICRVVLYKYLTALRDAIVDVVPAPPE